MSCSRSPELMVASPENACGFTVDSEAALICIEYAQSLHGGWNKTTLHMQHKRDPCGIMLRAAQTSDDSFTT